jgi:hypothetical protein
VDINSKSDYSVVTGDVIGSTKLAKVERQKLFRALEEEFSLLKNIDIAKSDFEIFRGDGFQVICEPKDALFLMLTIKSKVRSIILGRKDVATDARLVAGIGRIEYPSNTVLSSDGEAYRLSGKNLDNLDEDLDLLIVTPNPFINRELYVEMYLINTIIKDWTENMAEIVNLAIKGNNQDEISKIIGVSQPSVSKSLKAAKWDAVKVLLNRYKEIYGG